jgi:hypothetical protein
MTNKGRRLATATSFLSGVITCLDALRDAPVSWPPDALWQVLSRPRRLELCGGIALILVTVVMTIVQARKD